MNCHQARRLLSVQREWAAQDRTAAESHLAGCPACQAVAREYELMDRRLGRLPQPALVVASPAVVRARLMIEEQKTESPAWPRLAIQEAALLAVVALVAVAVLLWQGGIPLPATEPVLVGAPAVEVSAPVSLPTPEPGAPEFAWPVAGEVSQTYWSGHQALDIASRVGAPVFAAADGVVAQVGRDDENGNFVLLDHADGYATFYSHLSAAYVEAGKEVTRGQKIGAVGITGKTTGPHLHFEVRQNGVKLNPLEALAGETPTSDTVSALKIYGIQAHALGINPKPVLEATQELGFGWVEQQVQWHHFEPSQGDYQWDELDALVIPADAADVKMLWSVVSAPDWAREGQDLSVDGPPNDPQDLADFLSAVAERYCGTSLAAVEVWDEQNLHYKWGNMTIDPTAYMELLKPTYAAIKAACPEMLVISGGLTPTGAPAPKAMDDVRYLESLYRLGLTDYTDAVGVHLPAYNLPPDADYAIYDDPSADFRGPFQYRHRSWSFRGSAEAYRQLMEEYGDTRPLWVTEFGWAVSDDPPQYWEFAGDNTPQEQAEYTLHAFELAREWGWVEAMFLWNLNFSVIDPGSEKALWSIVGSGWERTVTFEVLAEMEK